MDMGSLEPELELEPVLDPEPLNDEAPQAEM
jgi:hypothetical protein